MTTNLEALVYDRLRAIPDLQELDNEQVHAAAQEAVDALSGPLAAMHDEAPVSYLTPAAADLAAALRPYLERGW